MENNGRFDDAEETIGDETELVLMDLKNRSFIEGEEIFVTVVGVAADGSETVISEERSIVVQVPGTTALLEQEDPSSEDLRVERPLDSAHGASLEESDITPPEDARNLTLRKKLQDNGFYTVFAAWAPSYNTAGDLASYNLYESEDRGESFVGPTALLSTVLSATIANVPPGVFTLKMTSMDNSRNESAGIMESIILPQTGGAMVLLSLAGAGFWSFRRKVTSY